MTPSDWTKFQADRKIGLIATAKLIGLSPNMLSRYIDGSQPTPRKVALAVAAIAFGLPEYGTPASGIGA